MTNRLRRERLETIRGLYRPSTQRTITCFCVCPEFITRAKSPLCRHWRAHRRTHRSQKTGCHRSNRTVERRFGDIDRGNGARHQKCD